MSELSKGNFFDVSRGGRLTACVVVDKKKGAPFAARTRSKPTKPLFPARSPSFIWRVGAHVRGMLSCGGYLSIAGYGSEVAKWKELLLPIARGEGAAPLSPTERAKFFFGILDGSEEQADEYHLR